MIGLDYGRSIFHSSGIWLISSFYSGHACAHHPSDRDILLGLKGFWPYSSFCLTSLFILFVLTYAFYWKSDASNKENLHTSFPPSSSTFTYIPIVTVISEKVYTRLNPCWEVSVKELRMPDWEWNQRRQKKKKKKREAKALTLKLEFYYFIGHVWIIPFQKFVNFN